MHTGGSQDLVFLSLRAMRRTTAVSFFLQARSFLSACRACSSDVVGTGSSPFRPSFFRLRFFYWYIRHFRPRVHFCNPLVQFRKQVRGMRTVRRSVRLVHFLRHRRSSSRPRARLRPRAPRAFLLHVSAVRSAFFTWLHARPCEPKHVFLSDLAARTAARRRLLRLVRRGRLPRPFLGFLAVPFRRSYASFSTRTCTKARRALLRALLSCCHRSTTSHTSPREFLLRRGPGWRRREGKRIPSTGEREGRGSKCPGDGRSGWGSVWIKEDRWLCLESYKKDQFGSIAIGLGSVRGLPGSTAWIRPDKVARSMEARINYLQVQPGPSKVR